MQEPLTKKQLNDKLIELAIENVGWDKRKEPVLGLRPSQVIALVESERQNAYEKSYLECQDDYGDGPSQ